MDSMVTLGVPAYGYGIREYAKDIWGVEVGN